MCGIARILGPGAEYQGPVLAAMSAHIAYRGPEDDGVWQSSAVALAHRRLSIIDLSANGHQPMLSDCGRYAIVFNSEIYNQPGLDSYPAPLHEWLRRRPENLRGAVARRDCTLIKHSVWARDVNAFLDGSDADLESTWRGFVIAEWQNTFFRQGPGAKGGIETVQSA